MQEEIAEIPQRYKQQGYGLFLSIFIAISFFVGLPQVFKTYWPTILSFGSEKQVFG